MVCVNFSRSLAGILAASATKKWGSLYSVTALLPRPFPSYLVGRAYGKSLKSEAKPEKDSRDGTRKTFPELPRPSVIPFQTKVANSVHLVGTIDAGVKLHQLLEESYASASILVNENTGNPDDFSRFSIPIIFRGDLAEAAACHLKKNDLIYVSGQLSGDSLPFTEKDAKHNIKLLAYNLNFVKEASSHNRSQFIVDEASTSHSGYMKTSCTALKSSWDELIIDPEKWIDKRALKEQGLLNIKGPDFIHKETRIALWLNSAPDWVLPRLEGLAFSIDADLSKLTNRNSCRDQQWKRFVENPKDWWDNRATKPKPTYPDFKHKDDGESLWLNSAPSWVLPLLPPSPA